MTSTLALHYRPARPLLNTEDGIVVLIPARNEEKSLASVIGEIRKEFTGEIVLIDDASTDNTREIAFAAGITVLPLVNHLGAWCAIQTGLRYALRSGYRIAITMDADGQHVPAFIHSLVEPLMINDSDVVIGAFTKRASSARRLAWSIFRVLSGIALKDLTSGLRSYNREAMRLLAAPPSTLIDYQDIGVLISLQHVGLRIVERQVIMRQRSHGRSQIFGSSWKVGFYMFQTVILCLTKRKWLSITKKRVKGLLK